MFHVQQKNLTALHLKPRILRRDIRATVDTDFARKKWLDIEYITKKRKDLSVQREGKLGT